MTRHFRRGFTVIETMLFLAISGLLAVGIIGGTGYAINLQRYKDAVNSLQSYVQSEYGMVANTQNDRATLLTCSSGVLSTDGAGQPRGATNCLIIGRLITVAADGKSLHAQTVYAGTDSSEQPDDISALKNATLFVSDIAQAPADYALEWGTAVALPGGATPAGYQILIARSPMSGAIRTFIAEQGLQLADMIADTTRLDQVFCVDSSGLVTFGNRGVKIMKDAAGASAIKVTEEGC